jgi:hypothetical protein
MSENYKFRSIKIYTSNEWLYESKKYRHVFDVAEVKHIYIELAFFNKQFDEQEWTANINLKAFSITNTRTELCNIHLNKSIKPDENVVYIREGWGQETSGSYWKEGEYLKFDDSIVNSFDYFLSHTLIICLFFTQNEGFFIS